MSYKKKHQLNSRRSIVSKAHNTHNNLAPPSTDDRPSLECPLAPVLSTWKAAGPAWTSCRDRACTKARAMELQRKACSPPRDFQGTDRSGMDKNAVTTDCTALQSALREEHVYLFFIFLWGFLGTNYFDRESGKEGKLFLEMIGKKRFYIQVTTRGSDTAQRGGNLLCTQQTWVQSLAFHIVPKLARSDS